MIQQRNNVAEHSLQYASIESSSEIIETLNQNENNDQNNNLDPRNLAQDFTLETENTTTNVNSDHTSSDDENKESSNSFEFINSNLNLSVETADETNKTTDVNLDEMSLHEILPHIGSGN